MTTTPRVSTAIHQANLSDASAQHDPAIVDIGSGRYIVVWTQPAGGPISPSATSDLIGQIFDAADNRVGAEFRVNTVTINSEQDAALASRPGGGFLMVYEGSNASGTAIYVDTRDVNGAFVPFTPTTVAFDTNDDILSNPSVAIRADNTHLVAYNRQNVSGDGSTDVVGRIANSAGTYLGEFSLFNSADVARNPDVDVLTNGNYVVVFEDADDATLTDFDPQFTIRNSAGGAVTSGTIDSGANNQNDVHVAALTGGGFVATWTENNVDGSGLGIRARVYDNGGVAQGAAFTVNTSTAGQQFGPDVAALKDGGFVIVWDNENLGLVGGQRFDAAGHKIGVEFTAGSMGAEENAVVTTLGDGRFVVGFEQIAGDSDIWTTTFTTGWNAIASGDFNGDGTDDILWQNAVGGTSEWLMSPAGGIASFPFTPPAAGWSVVASGDFNGDGTDDIMWKNDATGSTAEWLMAPTGGASLLGTPPAPGWNVVADGDFNGDHITDIMWKNAATGSTSVWLMAPTGGAGSLLSTSPAGGWNLVASGDFNGDGTDDVLWQNAGTGATSEWLMAGGSVASNPFTPGTGGWDVVATGDFNNDGITDVMWKNAATGTTSDWLMSAGGGIGSNPFTPAAGGWNLIASGDFNGDGTDDLMWQNAATGATSEWLMAGGGIGSNPFTPAAPGWDVVAVGDLNGDANIDLMWQNALTGATSEWLMAPGGGGVGAFVSTLAT